MRARQRKRLTRKDAARRLSIGIKDVKAIDQWDLKALAPHVNIKNTVRQYALMVGQKPSMYAGYVPDQPAAKYEDKSIVTLSKTTFSLVGILVALIAAGFIGWRTYVATASPHLEVFEPQAGITVQNPKITVSGETSEQAEVIINGINTPVSPDGTFSGEAILSEGPNTIEVRSINSFEKESIVTRTVFFEHVEDPED